ncbi:replication-associated protein [Werosea circovirus]|uniref:Replication-associated protein n=1 Tax=Werosea circovirus TaxID=2682467 RepID=A0A7S5GA58_9CIRC|nr:replication-associated protein [Werosea circovirus]QGR26087.1 replication-associated protein [Werosea circovirus]
MATPAKQRKRDNPVKRWCLTLNNPTDEEKAALTAKLTEDNCEYAIIGNEVGDNGTPHLQGFVNLKKKLRLKQMKELISPRAHLEQAMGSDSDNEDYCSKGGSIYLAIGTPSKQGKRSDLLAAAEMLTESCGDMTALAQAMPAVFIKYGRGLSNWVDYARISKPRDFKTNVTVWYGPPGCGKSRAAALLSSGKDVYYKTRGEWWDGYNGQEVVIIDDFYGWLKYDELLRICDRYPHRVPVKGAFVNFLAKDVYITSNAEITGWYKFDKFDATALMRRVTKYLVWNERIFAPYEETPMYTPLLPINY